MQGGRGFESQVEGRPSGGVHLSAQQLAKVVCPERPCGGDGAGAQVVG